MVMEDPILGALLVRSRFVTGLADSADADLNPNLLPAIGTWEFVPNLRGSDPLVHLPDGLMITPVPVVCKIRADGWMIPPGDGAEAEPTGTDAEAAEPVLRLIAPDQSFNIVDWTWTATAKPAAGQKWKSFQRVFGGAPGDEINLGIAVATEPSAGVSQALVYEVETNQPPYPVGYRLGTDVLLTPDGKFWMVD